MKKAPTTPSRDRLFHAAIKIFAKRGYEGASTREISKEAQTNISAILYYFEGKEGLYQKVLEYIAGTVQAEMASKMRRAREALDKASLSNNDYRIIAQDLFTSFIRFLLSDKISPSVARIFLREQIEPSPGFVLFYETVMKPFHETFTRLISRMACLPYPSEQATLCANAILGSITIFKTHSEMTLRRMNWKKYNDKEIDKITETVLRHADFIMEGYRRNQLTETA